MIQTSADFENVVNRETRTFLARMIFDTFTLSEKIRQITIYMGNADGEAFIDGAAYSSHVNISMNTPGIDIAGQEFRLEIGLLLDDESVEYVPIGVYKAAAADITKTKYTMTVTAWDRMGKKANTVYEPTVLYPCTAGAVLDDITNQTGLVFNTSAFPTIRQEDGLSFPESYLISDVIGFIAGLKGGFAYVDNSGTVVMAKYPVASSMTVPAARCLDEIVLADSPITVDAGGDVTEYSYYPGTVRFLGDPRLELTDMLAVVDTGEAVRNVPCIGITMTFDGGLVTVVSAPSQTTSDREYGPVQKRINAALLAAETAQETAAEAMETAGEAEQTASVALIAANGKSKIFYQAGAPETGMSVGDMWFDTDGGNAVYEYTSSGWVLRQFGHGAIAAKSVTAAEIMAASITVNELSADVMKAMSIIARTLVPDIIQSNDYAYNEIPYVYPASTLYTSEGSFPSNGESVTKGFAIDFVTGEIRGAFYSAEIEILRNRITALEDALTYPKA